MKNACLNAYARKDKQKLKELKKEKETMGLIRTPLNTLECP